MPFSQGGIGGLTGATWTAWSPGYTGFSANPGVPAVSQWTSIGNVCIVMYQDASTGTSNATTYTMTGLPKTPTAPQSFMVVVDDNGVTLTAPGQATIASGSTTVTFAKVLGGSGGFTASGGKAVLGMTLIYSF